MNLLNFKPKNTMILQFNKNGEFVAEWSSVEDAAQAIEGRAHDIHRCLGGLLNTTKGYQFKWKSDVTPIYKIEAAKKERVIKKGVTPVAMYQKNKVVRIFEKLVDAANHIGVRPETLSMHVRGHVHRAGINGYTFKKAIVA